MKSRSVRWLEPGDLSAEIQQATLAKVSLCVPLCTQPTHGSYTFVPEPYTFT